MEHSTVANNGEKVPPLFCHVQTKQKDKSYTSCFYEKNKIFHLY